MLIGIYLLRLLKIYLGQFWGERRFLEEKLLYFPFASRYFRVKIKRKNWGKDSAR